jgi:UDP-N-acetylglucosamine--N-acetylmuramyl-(pentapeptide) pyrophosphoryl-undecaprenol N-acetylglucosamine transferase
MRIALAGGGTGGHVYPLLAVADALRVECVDHPLDLLFIGGTSGMERDIAQRAGLSYAGVSAGAVRGRSPVGVGLAGAKQVMGLVGSLRVLGRFRPHVVLATGGFVSVPPVLAAWLLRIPTMLYLPDVRPGLAVRTLAPFVDRIAVTTDASRPFLPSGKVTISGYPVRPELWMADRVASRAAMSVRAHDSVLLVVGGSRGARSLNQAVFRSLPTLLEKWQVIHVTGADDQPEASRQQAMLEAAVGERYRPRAFLHTPDIACALSAADLVVSRAGASVLGEYPAVGVPSVLVPLPFAGSQQRPNAEYLEAAGAAISLDNAALVAGGLLPLLNRLRSEPERLPMMRRATCALARPGAAESIAAELTLLARRGRAPT